jgi:hypothetical protein
MPGCLQTSITPHPAQLTVLAAMRASARQIIIKDSVPAVMWQAQAGRMPASLMLV